MLIINILSMITHAEQVFFKFPLLVLLGAKYWKLTLVFSLCRTGVIALNIVYANY